MTSSGWYGLLSIVQEAKKEAEEQRSRPPSACPRCGEPLETGPRSELHCRFDGWVNR